MAHPTKTGRPAAPNVPGTVSLEEYRRLQGGGAPSEAPAPPAPPAGGGATERRVIPDPPARQQQQQTSGASKEEDALDYYVNAIDKAKGIDTRSTLYGEMGKFAGGMKLYQALHQPAFPFAVHDPSREGRGFIIPNPKYQLQDTRQGVPAVVVQAKSPAELAALAQSNPEAFAHVQAIANDALASYPVGKGQTAQAITDLVTQHYANRGFDLSTPEGQAAMAFDAISLNNAKQQLYKRAQEEAYHLIGADRSRMAAAPGSPPPPPPPNDPPSGGGDIPWGEQTGGWQKELPVIGDWKNQDVALSALGLTGGVGAAILAANAMLNNGQQVDPAMAMLLAQQGNRNPY